LTLRSYTSSDALVRFFVAVPPCLDPGTECRAQGIAERRSPVVRRSTPWGREAALSVKSSPTFLSRERAPLSKPSRHITGFVPTDVHPAHTRTRHYIVLYGCATWHPSDVIEQSCFRQHCASALTNRPKSPSGTTSNRAKTCSEAPHSPGMRVGAVPATDLQELMCLSPSTMAVSTVQQTSSCFVQPGCQCKPPPVTPRFHMHVACAGPAYSRATSKQQDESDSSI
jgi:hypothetical protein